MDLEGVANDPLTGRWFSLVPFQPMHYPMLYELSFRDQNSFRWRYRGSMPAYPVFEQNLHSGVLCQFAVCPNDRLTLFSGLVVAYDANFQDSTCFLATIIDKRVGPAAIEGVGLFIRYLFRYWPLRKIYLEVVEYNLPQYASAVRRGLFKEEGRLRLHQYFDNRYWDKIILSVSREDAIQFESDNNLLPE